MAAAALSLLAHGRYRIRVVESDQIAALDAAEGTLPGIKLLNKQLKIDEDELLRATQGTFKLGTQFVNWGQIGESYVHGFGAIGRDVGPVAFHHYWLKQSLQDGAGHLDDYSINTLAALQSKYMRGRPEMAGSPLADIPNAFHVDAGAYAQYLRRQAQARGVVRIEGRIVEVSRRDDGFIGSLLLAAGERIAGDFFIDCSGIGALLIGAAMGVPFEDWSQWLPCDREIAVSCAPVESMVPYTRATAHAAGWQWRIPLQHRTGNGHVFCSRLMSEDEATSILMGNLDAEPLADPRCISFVPGRRREAWVKNCVAVGLSSGCFEPLESTNIHLIQTAVNRIISLFPTAAFHQADIDEYNRQTQFEYERVRDVLVLHYKATGRTDSDFWNHCRQMAIPPTLQHKIDLFSAAGRVFRDGAELFGEASWTQIMIGQGIRPQSYHPLVDALTADELARYSSDVRGVIQKCVNFMPTHAKFLAEHCAADGIGPI
jgi:tryptophan halogenase